MYAFHSFLYLAQANNRGFLLQNGMITPSNTLNLPSPLLPPSSSSSQETKRRRNDSTLSSPSIPVSPPWPSVSNHFESPVINSFERPSKRSRHSNSSISPKAGAGGDSSRLSSPSQQPADQGINRPTSSRSPDGEGNSGRKLTADHLNEHERGVDTTPGSAPLSPTTTLANSTPYIDATNWATGESMSPSTKMLTPFMPATSSSKEKQLVESSTNSGSAGGGGGGGSDLGEVNRSNTRPRLPSIAAMLNSPKTISSPSLFASNMIGMAAGNSADADAVGVMSNFTGTVSALLPPDLSPGSNSGFALRSDTSHPFIGAERSSYVSAPFQLPSSSLPITSSYESVDDSHSSRFKRVEQDHHGQDFEEDDEETSAAAALLMQFSSERDRDGGRGSSHSHSYRRGNTSGGSDASVLGTTVDVVSVAAYTPGSILGFGKRHH